MWLGMVTGTVRLGLLLKQHRVQVRALLKEHLLQLHRIVEHPEHRRDEERQRALESRVVCQIGCDLCVVMCVG